MKHRNRTRQRWILCIRNMSILRQTHQQNTYTTMMRCTLWIALLHRKDSNRDSVTACRCNYIYLIFSTMKCCLFTPHLHFLKLQISHYWQIWLKMLAQWSFSCHWYHRTSFLQHNWFVRNSSFRKVLSLRL